MRAGSELGWNHHVTLAMMAHAFLTLERVRNKIIELITLISNILNNDITVTLPLQDLRTELSHGHISVT